MSAFDIVVLGHVAVALEDRPRARESVMYAIFALHRIGHVVTPEPLQVPIANLRFFPPSVGRPLNRQLLHPRSVSA